MRRQVIIGAVISLLCLAWAYGRLDPSALWGQLRGLDPWRVAGINLLLLFTYGLRLARWRRLLLPVKDCRPAGLWAAQCIGFMANYVLPARLGEVIRVYAAGRICGLPLASTAASVVVERVLDGLAICLYLFFGLVFIAPDAAAGQFNVQVLRAAGYGLLGLFLAVAGLCAAYLRWPGLVERFIRAVPRRISPRLARKMSAVLAEFGRGLAALASPGSLLVLAAQSLLIWFMYILMNSFFLPAAGLPFDLLMGVMVLVGGALASSVPSGPGYVGSFQLAVYWALCMAGAEPERAMNYAVLIWLATYLTVVLPGIYYLYKYGLKLGELRRAGTKGAA